MIHSTRAEMRGCNRKLCRTHFVGDVQFWKASCYIIWCNRCGFNEGIGSWYAEMWKKSGRHVWSKKQWPFIYAAIQMLEMGKAESKSGIAYRHKYYTKEERAKGIKDCKESWHKWIEETIK